MPTQVEHARRHYDANKAAVKDAARRWKERNPKAVADQRRRYKLKRHYGLTPAQVQERIAQQGGCCAICCRAFGEHPHNWPCVDHSHKTGKVRGILCGSCNRGIGQLQDSVKVLTSAINYLVEHQHA